MRRVALVLLVVALAYAGPGLLPGRTFAPLDVPLDADAWKDDPSQRIRVSNSLLGDVVVQFIPWDLEILRMLSRGELPWTNRYAGDGSPLFANPQTALFSPFTWPRLVLGLDGWAWMALLKILVAGTGMYWFARELEATRAEATISGIVFATAGYSIVWLLYPITHVFAFLPAFAAGSLRLMKRPSIHNAALVILFAALCSAGGHPETLFLGVSGVFLFLAWEAERRPGMGFSAIIPSCIGALLGFLLLAFQIVPFLIILGDSHAQFLRPTLAHPFRWWAIVSQLLPGALGSPVRGELDLTALPMAENFNLRTGGFIGALVLMAIVLAWRELSPSLRRGLKIGIVALVVSWFPPGLWAVVRNVPVVRMLTLEYLAALFVFFGALAAGPAIAIAASRARKKAGLGLVLVGMVALVAGLLPSIPPARPSLTSVARYGIDELRERGHFRQPAEVYERRLGEYLDAAGLTTLRRLALPGACWLLAGVALAFSFRRRATLVALAATGELLAFGVGFNPAVRMKDVPPPPDVVRTIAELDPSRQHLIAEHFEVFPANLATLYEIRDAISYDAMNTDRRVRELLPAGYDPMLHTFNPILSPEQVRRLAPIGVRFVLSRHDVAGARRIEGPPPPAVGVYEIEGAVPMPMPANIRPAGLLAGAVVSLMALLASAVWLRLYLLEPVAAPANRLPP